MGAKRVQGILAVGRNENDVQARVELRELFCKLQPVHVRHFDIQKRKIHRVLPRIGKGVLGIEKRFV